ncbi:MAG: hypothetical protein WBP94_09460 [Rhodomicrobiaceae bacterium]
MVEAYVAIITQEMQIFLDYAEEHRLCLYQVMDSTDADYEGWEDCLWHPRHLRQALLDYPDQPRAGKAYPPYSYPYDINNHMIWRIVDLNDLHFRFEAKARDIEAKAHDMLKEAKGQKEMAEYFKKIWIEKTELLYGLDLGEAK